MASGKIISWPFHFLLDNISFHAGKQTNKDYFDKAVTCRDMRSCVLEHVELVGNTDWILEFKQPFSLNLI